MPLFLQSRGIWINAHALMTIEIFVEEERSFNCGWLRLILATPDIHANEYFQ